MAKKKTCKKKNVKTGLKHRDRETQDAKQTSAGHRQML